MAKKIKILLFVLIFSTFVLGLAIGVQGEPSGVNKEVNYLNNQIDSKKKKIENIKSRREEYAQEIRRLQDEQASLENQLAILNNRLAQIELDIEDTKEKISKANLEIRKVNFEIKNKKKEIKEEKEHISDILNLMYKQNQADTLEVLLMNDSLSDFLNKIRYLEDVNQEMENSVSDLKRNKKKLEEDKLSLGEKKEKLAELKDELQYRKGKLENQQKSKSYILEKTESSESKYQSLLTQAKREREQISREIVSLEKEVRQKMERLEEKDIEPSSDGLIWPTGNRRITAYFHDPEYPFRYLFEHPAIDIAVSQGSTIKSADSGYVARVKYNPNSSSYAYIMIVHGDGLATVYGHISKPLVSEEEYVTQGQPIALSGGMPGTAGAGHLTSGPHLHFEVRVNGIPNDPLNYLPN